MKKTIIGFDLDDVLFDFVTPLTEWCNKNYNTNLSRADYFSFDLHKVWNCTGEEAVARIHSFYASQEHEEAAPVQGAMDMLKDLEASYSFVIITARPDSMEQKTRKWLSEYFPNMFDEVYFTNHFHNTHKKRLKSEVCKEIGVSLFIDDSLHNAEDVASAGIPVLLLNTPWNQLDKEIPGVTRVYSCEDIALEIKKI